MGGKPVIRVLQHLARTGGTLICKCLGSMDKISLFSETHPTGFLPEQLDFFDIMVQAHRWHRLIRKAELRAWLEEPGPVLGARFLSAVTLLHQRCLDRGKLLLLRDWSHIDYTARPFAFSPTYRPRLAEELAGSFNVLRTATVRHPIRQYLSLTAFMPELRDTLAPEEFSLGCLRFAEHAVEMGFIRYEDFLQDPDTGLKTLCERLGLPFDKSYATRWMHYAKITGDRSKATEIKPQPARPVSRELVRAFDACEAYRKTLELLGYEPLPDYAD